MLRCDIKDFLNTIDKNICVVAATKYVGPNEMKDLLNAGVNNFGENRVDAFLEKYEELKNENITWHFIGHLQRNKALKIIDKIDYLHSLDSIELAKIIDKNRTTPLKCFIEVSVNEEESKDGVLPEYLYHFVNQLLELKNIEIVGLMMMSIKYSNHSSLLGQFQKLKELRDDLQDEYNINIPYLSMGMSDDYKEALQCGATHIRLGRILWTN